MDKLFELKVLTPERMVFSGKISSLIAPGEIGYFGVLTNHAPFISILRPGKLSLRDGNGKTSSITSKGNGYFKVYGNVASVLLDSVEAKT